MIELAKAEKKVWIAPALDELAIEKTLGGLVRRQSESTPFTIETPRGDVDTFGSVYNR